MLTIITLLLMTSLEFFLIAWPFQVGLLFNLVNTVSLIRELSEDLLIP